MSETLDEKAVRAACMANLNPDAEPSSVELAKMEKSIRAYLAAGAVGGGWRLVPVEPTDEMIEAGEEEIQERHSVGCGIYASDIWDAMLSASPAGRE